MLKLGESLPDELPARSPRVIFETQCQYRSGCVSFGGVATRLGESTPQVMVKYQRQFAKLLPASTSLNLSPTPKLIASKTSTVYRLMITKALFDSDITSLMLRQLSHQFCCNHGCHYGYYVDKPPIYQQQKKVKNSA